MQNNLVCDDACDTYNCDRDSGLCNNCRSEYLGDGVCDDVCDFSEYDFDGFDCRCAEGCEESMLGNGVCNEKCIGYQCDYDRGDECVRFI